MNNSELHFLSRSEAAMLVNSIDDLKHKCLILVMLDAGLRVSEAISLTFGNFDFKKQNLCVRSLKKRKQSKDFQNRTIPLSQRLFLCLADYAREFDRIDRDTLLFPSPTSKNKPIRRQSVHLYLKRLSIRKCNIPNLHPHALRHSFATGLVATGSDLHEIADLLGHQQLDYARIYTHIPQDKLSRSINAASVHHGAKRRFLNFFGFLFAKRPVVPYIPDQKHTPVIGRGSELAAVSGHLEKGTNVIVFGSYGTGKRLLLESIKTDRKILTFDDTASIKKSLVYMLIYLYENDKEQVAGLLFKNFDRDKTETRLSRQSVGYLCDEIKKLVKPKEYVLKIKQFDDVTKQALKVIENLKDAFVILTSAVEISITKAPFFWDFEKVEIKNLGRLPTFELIHKLSNDLEIEDYEIYRNHIWQQTDGNPKAITEMVNRYRREPNILTETVRSITHSGALKEFDCTYALVILIAGLAVMRYMTSELDNPGFRMIGGLAMILLLLTRAVAARTKRKTI
jgi:hypothetical protein